MPLNKTSHVFFYEYIQTNQKLYKKLAKFRIVHLSSAKSTTFWRKDVCLSKTL